LGTLTLVYLRSVIEPAKDNNWDHLPIFPLATSIHRRIAPCRASSFRAQCEPARRYELSEWEKRGHASAVDLVSTPPDPTPPKAIGRKHGQNALRADTLERLPLTTMGASAKAERIDYGSGR
jgi:hypothetical protein